MDMCRVNPDFKEKIIEISMNAPSFNYTITFIMYSEIPFFFLDFFPDRNGYLFTLNLVTEQLTSQISPRMKCCLKTNYIFQNRTQKVVTMPHWQNASFRKYDIISLLSILLHFPSCLLCLWQSVLCNTMTITFVCPQKPAKDHHHCHGGRKSL